MSVRLTAASRFGVGEDRAIPIDRKAKLYDAINDGGPDPADVGITNRSVTERASA
jgi:hypothetical protein